MSIIEYSRGIVLKFKHILFFVLTTVLTSCSNTGSEFRDDNSATSLTISGSETSINQSVIVGTSVAKVNITQTGKAPVTTMKLYGINATYFDITPEGNITLSSTAILNSSIKPLYTLTVIAKNTDEMSNRATVKINIVNTDLPRMEDFSENIDENISKGSVVGSLNIYTHGSSQISVINLFGTGASDFVISKLGEITLSSTASLSFNSKKLYSLTAVAVNASGNSNTIKLEIAVNQVTTLIETPLLMIALSFNDKKIQDSILNWHNKIFGNSPGEINHYFTEVSSGRQNIVPVKETQGTLNDGIISMSMGINHPGKSGINRTFLTAAAKRAIASVDFASYDKNSDGNLDSSEFQLMFIVAGGEAATGGNPRTSVWAHAGTPLNSTNELFDGVTIPGYSLFGEIQFPRSSANLATIGVIVHELGHAMLNLPDLYARAGSGDGSGGIGEFGLMSSGSWTVSKRSEHAGQTPTYMCAWSKIKAGWLTPQNVNVTTNNIAMNATHSSKYNIVKIPTDNAQEYFLVENRSPKGYDAGLYDLDNAEFTGGIAIWHIDESRVTEQNDVATHKLVDLEEANNPVIDSTNDRINDGTVTNLYYSGNSNLFSNTTSTNSKKYDGTATNISVNNISIVGSAGDEYVMRVDVTR